jgi:septal ring factor EnvC (AmiA/AmiB activator)
MSDPARCGVAAPRRRCAGTALPLSCLLCGLILAVIGAGTVQALEDPKAKAAELEQLRTRMQTLRKELDADRNRQGGVQSELRESELRVGEVAGRLRDIDTRMQQTRTRLQDLQGRESGLQARIAEERAGLAGQVRAAYMLGRQEQLKLMLSQEDPARLGRVLAYHDYLNRIRVTRINRVREQVDALAALEREIGAELDTLTALRTTQQAERDQLEAVRAERATLLAGINADIHSKDRALTGLAADEARLKKVLAAIEAALTAPEQAAAAPFASLKGRLPWPVSGHAPKPAQARRGLIIAAPTGSEVRAVAHGRVAFAEWLRGFGLLLIIDHGGGYMSLYGHNQSLYKETGDWVDAGDLIAGVGDSGGQTRSGLYFEIRHRGQPIDAKAWCVARAS